MTIAKDFASKFAVAIVAAAMILMAVAPSARAATQTPEDLQKTINDLLAQVASLQTKLGGTTTTAPATSCTSFTMNLKKGSTGAEVKALQMLLNGDADTMVAMTGAGSKGMETMTYGPATMAAVSKFQVKYRAEILTPAGLVNATGVFGPSSRAQANKLCAGASTSTTTTSTGGTTTTTSDLSGEADLHDVTVDSPSDSKIEEGSSKTDIGTFTVNFKNGDAKIDRLDIKLAHSGSGVETHPWKAFDTIYVMVDGKEVSSQSVTSRTNDYLDDTAGTIRLSGLNIVAKQDKDVVITIAADLQKPNSGASNDWKLSADSIRFFDAAGVASTDSSVGDLGSANTSDFTIDKSGTNDEVIVKSNSSNPADSTLEVKDNAKSDWYTTLVFDLDTKDSISDITVNDIYTTVTVSSSTYGTIVDDARLTVDGTVIDSSISDVTLSNSNKTGTIKFDTKGKVVINAGDRVEAKLELKFKSLVAGNEGVTVTSSETSGNVAAMDAEGSDTLTGSSQLSGSATGKIMTLRTKGIDASSVSKTAVLTAATAASGSHDYVTYTVKVDVTAFNQDLYISKTPGTALTYTATDNAGNATTTSNTVVDSFTSTANDTDAPGYFHVAEGSTETFTMIYKWSPAAAKAARGIQLTGIKYAETAVAPTSTWTATPASDYRTDAVSTNI